MFYGIMGRKENKAFCYPLDNVEILDQQKIYARDIKRNRFDIYSKWEYIKNPNFTGRECLGYKEIYLSL